MTEAASKTTPSNAPIVAAVVDPSDNDAPAYGMFALQRLTAEGAFLVGAIFFERGEEFTVELSGGGRDSLRLRAKVVSHERTPVAGMVVTFHGVTEADRKVLAGFSTGTA